MTAREIFLIALIIFQVTVHRTRDKRARQNVPAIFYLGEDKKSRDARE